jgi:hypothetical protein
VVSVDSTERELTRGNLQLGLELIVSLRQKKTTQKLQVETSDGDVSRAWLL